MLVLSRKPNEGVVIGGRIVVRILSTQNGRVRLGIEAPDEILVLREEIATRQELHPGATVARSEFGRAQ